MMTKSNTKDKRGVPATPAKGEARAPRKTRTKTKPNARKKTTPRHKKLFAAIDLHKATCVIGSMTEGGDFLGTERFPTRAEALVRHVRDLPCDEVYLTIEASSMSRWAARLLRPHCAELIVCNPRENRLISTSTRKGDEFDVHQLCRIYRMGELAPTWVGDSDARDVFRYAVYDMIKLRDRAREAKTLIKSRLTCWGLPIPAGREVFGTGARQRWLDQLPSDNARTVIAPLYAHFDAAKAAEQALRREVTQLGAAFPEIARLQGVPGVAFAGSHIFVAIIEDPHRFSRGKSIHRYAGLGVTSRSSDGKQLGYERLDRRGFRELKNLSYHAWRTATRSTTRDNAVKSFYQASKERTGSVTHARLATQRKVLTTMWVLWRKGIDYSDENFLHSPDQRRARQAPKATAPTQKTNMKKPKA